MHNHRSEAAIVVSHFTLPPYHKITHARPDMLRPFNVLLCHDSCYQSKTSPGLNIFRSSSGSKVFSPTYFVVGLYLGWDHGVVCFLTVYYLYQ